MIPGLTAWVGKSRSNGYPTLTKNHRYEVELLAALHRGGRNIPIAIALELVYAYGVGLGMTRPMTQLWDTAFKGKVRIS